MSIDHGAVLLYGICIDGEDVEKWDIENDSKTSLFEKLKDLADGTWNNKTSAKMRKNDRDGGKAWMDLDTGLYVYQSSYYYDADQIDFYACCAYFETDDEWATEVNIPPISAEQAAAIEARLKRAIAAKGIPVKTSSLRWHVMTRAT